MAVAAPAITSTLHSERRRKQQGRKDNVCTKKENLSQEPTAEIYLCLLGQHCVTRKADWQIQHAGWYIAASNVLREPVIEKEKMW